MTASPAVVPSDDTAAPVPDTRRGGAAEATPAAQDHPPVPAPGGLHRSARARDLVPALPPAHPAPDRPGRDGHAGLRDLHLRHQPADGRRRQPGRRTGSTSARPRATGSPGCSTPAATRSACMQPPVSTGTDHVPVYLAYDPLTQRGLRVGPPDRLDLHLRRQPARTSARSTRHSRSRAGSRWRSRSTPPATSTSPT